MFYGRRNNFQNSFGSLSAGRKPVQRAYRGCHPSRASTLMLSAAGAADPNRLGVVMLSRPLPRFAIVAPALFFLASGSYFAQAAPADDAPKTAHESAVLDRIFASWKTRHD